MSGFSLPFVKFTHKHLSKWVVVFTLFERSEFSKYNEWDLVWIGNFIGVLSFGYFSKQVEKYQVIKQKSVIFGNDLIKGI